MAIMNALAEQLALADAYSRKDREGVQRQFEALEEQKNFAFMVPLLRTWEARQANTSVKPFFDAAKKNRTAAYYHDEQLILILLSLGENRRALEILAEFIAENPARSAPLRILSARHFLSLKDKETATVLLDENGSGPERVLLSQIPGYRREVRRTAAWPAIRTIANPRPSTGAQ